VNGLVRLENLDSSFPLLKAAYKCTKNLYEGKQPSWYGSVKHILQNMPSLTTQCSLEKNWSIGIFPFLNREVNGLK
jgi:hypothetical protein